MSFVKKTFRFSNIALFKAPLATTHIASVIPILGFPCENQFADVWMRIVWAIHIIRLFHYLTIYHAQEFTPWILSSKQDEIQLHSHTHCTKLRVSTTLIHRIYLICILRDQSHHSDCLRLFHPKELSNTWIMMLLCDCNNRLIQWPHLDVLLPFITHCGCIGRVGIFNDSGA